MNKIVLYLFLFTSLLSFLFGVYLTVVSKKDITKDTTKKTGPEWVTNNTSTLRVLGPVVLVVGIVCFSISGYFLTSMSKDRNDVMSSFGFKFY
jgi:uncharacterized protein with PQ loop repeat